VSRRTEELLQDYLDGRLSPEARERFEAEIEGDPELAALIEAYREQGRALREETPDLSPGFYTRARARFEESHDARKPLPARWLSWELAGVAAAAALAGVLFIPGLIEWEGKGKPFIDEMPPREERSRADDDIAPGRASVVEVDEKTEAETQAADDSMAASFDLAEELPAAGQTESEWGAEKGDERRQEELAPAALPKEEPLPARPEAELSRVQAAPSPAAEALGPAPSREKKGARSAKMGETGKRLETMMDAEGAPGIRRPGPLPLPQGTVPPGELIVIETEEQWLNLIEGPARGSMLSSLAYDQSTRWILIGPRPEGMDCATIRIEVAAASYRITLVPPADPDRAAEWGCALALPRDGMAVSIVGGEDDGNE
jgi:hypothetical protein